MQRCQGFAESVYIWDTYTVCVIPAAAADAAAAALSGIMQVDK